MKTNMMYTLEEFYNNWDIDVNAQDNNDVMVVIDKSNTVVKVLQNGKNIML